MKIQDRVGKLEDGSGCDRGRAFVTETVLNVGQDIGLGCSNTIETTISIPLVLGMVAYPWMYIVERSSILVIREMR